MQMSVNKHYTLATNMLLMTALITVWKLTYGMRVGVCAIGLASDCETHMVEMFIT